MLTSARDIASWALVALAAEPYVVTVLGTYTPILLEQLARNNGVLESDHITRCVSSPEYDPIPQPPDSFSNQISQGCVLPIMNGRFYIDTASYALYTFSLSVLMQTLCVLTISGIADNSNYKKILMVSIGVIGSITTMLFFVLNSNNYYLASVLAILANCSFGCINVLMNSYLSMLIKHYPYGEFENAENLEINNIDPTEFSRVGSKISGIGASTGYSAALFTQIGSLFLLFHLKSEYSDVVWCIKIVIGTIGIWWFVWQIPISLFLRELDDNIQRGDGLSLLQMIKKGYKDLLHALAKIHDLKDIFYFLIGWFVLSDSITTINSTAILFAKTKLHMSTTSLGKIGILVMISAISGSIIVPNIIISKYKWNLQQVMLGLILWCLVVPVYGILALSRESEMYILAIWYGIGMGGINTVGRSIFSIIIPSGKENVFFSIFSLTDKTSSIVGPFVVGLIINMFHDIRYAFWVLAILLLASLPIFSSLFNLKNAQNEASIFI